MPRAEETVEVRAAVNVSLATRGSAMRTTGISFLIIGLVALLVGATALLLAYPDKWHAQTSESLNLMRATATGFGLGAVFVLFGFTAFAYSRTVVGHGGTDHYEAEPPLEHVGTSAQAAGWREQLAPEPEPATWGSQAATWPDDQDEWPDEQNEWPEQPWDGENPAWDEPEQEERHV